MKKQKFKYQIIGCDHRYVPENPYKKCSDCSLSPTDSECVDSIMVGERYYVYKKIEV